MEIFIILGLILLNGWFSLSEMSLVSMKRSRLESDAKRGDKKAQQAIDLSGAPDKFLSTVQIGITTVGILTGLFSGSSIADWLSVQIARIPIDGLETAAYSISVTVIVLIVTYLTLIFGELLPKRIAMNNPEKVARIVAAPMNFFSKIGSPFVWLLSVSTRGFMKLFGIPQSSSTKVTEDEIKAILQEGTDDGEIQLVEHDIVERVFNLGDRDVNSLMTHRNDLVWLDVEDPLDEIRDIIEKTVHNVYPVASEQLDDIAGVVFLKDFFAHFGDENFCLRDYLKPAQFVPETMSGYNVLELFRKSQQFYALVTDEFGSIQGIVTLNDLMEALVGNIMEPDEHDEQIVERNDGTWLVDGQYSFYDFLAYFDMEDLYQEHDFNTLSGLILDVLEHIPTTAETLRWKNFEMEIVDMDAARIDKVLVRRIEEA
ncbi:MAG: HlyC/CorC family transporter [Bacteroidales bacterium]|nr:HlyC/CorC family transporter [Bacteroidales bacterium]